MTAPIECGCGFHQEIREAQERAERYRRALETLIKKIEFCLPEWDGVFANAWIHGHAIGKEHTIEKEMVEAREALSQDAPLKRQEEP